MKWCCGYHRVDPRPLGFLWAPAERLALVLASARRVRSLLGGHWKPGEVSELSNRCFAVSFTRRSIVVQLSFFSTYLNKASVKQRLISWSMYLLQASTARGFDRTVVIEADPARSTLRFCISLTMYTPDISFPWVPPQMATRDSGGKETRSICC